MSELPKSYEPKEVDPKWREIWKKGNFFQANANSKKEPYTIIMPPPNVTGVLHMGHALVSTLQDILIRWKRMSGFEALWVPGTDHAGISTQTVVEKQLIQREGKRRKDYSREQFLGHVWKWKEESESKILHQIEQIGCSCDWTRYCFTLDQPRQQGVKVMFKKLYDQGLIYRGDYLVNWDPVTQTALADDEVEYEEREGHLWHFRYPLADGSGTVIIATTRPETMLGDTAVAVSPNDERYKSWIGKMIQLPLMNRLIPIIADHHVDPMFGTGMVKVTPAHDPNDYQMGLDHDLPFINIMTPDAMINENGGAFAGLSMREGRKAVVAAMEKLGLVEKIEPHTHRVGISYRSKATIEPYMSKQWFMKLSEFKQKLRSLVTEGKVKIVPKTWEQTYFHWIDNLRDWCISRQLWWGHQIPIWYNKNDPEKMICYAGEGIPPEIAQEADQWYQDDDVLDTWFSSALWPFTTLGWPENSADLDKFYPTSVLVTGHDILFFWVARMICMGEHTMGEVPFRETFLHGLIYGKSYWRNNPDGGITYVNAEEQHAFDTGTPLPKGVFSKWEKMSKSKGNIIDPMEMIDQYGTDAVRMALCASATHARQIDLDRRKFEEFKNFSNKVWNGSRFVFMNLDGNPEQNLPALSAESFAKGLDETILKLEDRWILSVMNRVIDDVSRHLGGYTFDQAATAAYEFFWKEFCAYYVEIVKPTLWGKEGSLADRENKLKILAIVLCNSIRLMHPMAPFITEELFSFLKERFTLPANENADPYSKECLAALQAKACCVSDFPRVVREADRSQQVEQTFATVEQAVYTIRNIRGEMNLPPASKSDVYVIGEQSDLIFAAISANQHILTALIKINRIECLTTAPSLPFSATGVLGGVKIMIPLPEEMIEKERVRLTKQKENLEGTIERAKKQLSNEEFVARAPEELIKKHKATLEKQEQELAEVVGKLAQFADSV